MILYCNIGSLGLHLAALILLKLFFPILLFSKDHIPATGDNIILFTGSDLSISAWKSFTFPGNHFVPIDFAKLSLSNHLKNWHLLKKPSTLLKLQVSNDGSVLGHETVTVIYVVVYGARASNATRAPSSNRIKLRQEKTGTAHSNLGNWAPPI